MTTTTARTVAPQKALRGAITVGLTLAAGVLFISVPLLVEYVSGDAFALMGLAALLLLLALPGLRRLQHGADGRVGEWGLRGLVGGLACLLVLIVSGDPLDAALGGEAEAVAEGAFMVVGALSAFAMVAGIIAFSVGMARAHVFPARAVWLFLGGTVVALLTESFEQSLRGPVPTLADVLPPASFIVAGIGLLLLGRAAARLVSSST
ncbi:hypothetical protein [Aeromicrobium sp.]|uniref:hypothetical protein n=1 Tax=Aeromicrobium sp. TaxID=1871063 RepID=UPI003C59709E